MGIRGIRYRKHLKIPRYKMHFIDCLAGLPELEKVIVMPFIRKAEEIDLSDIPNRYKVFTDMFDSRFVFCGVKLDFFFCSILLQEFKMLADERPVLEFAQVPFNHPLFIMYSSGTTGLPKCMVHSVGVSSKIRMT